MTTHHQKSAFRIRRRVTVRVSPSPVIAAGNRADRILIGGKANGTLNPFDAPENDALLVNERLEGLEWLDRKLTYAVFIGVRLKNCTLRNLNLAHSVFIGCYFRATQFCNCDLTACTFVDCKFPHATMTTCDLKYTEWKDCEVPLDELLGTLPQEPNLASGVLGSLRRNALDRYDSLEARRLLFQLVRRSELHYWNVAFAKTSYYRKKYHTLQRLTGFGRFMSIKLERLLWGFGERPLRLVASGAAVTLLFAFYYLWTAPQAFGSPRVAFLQGGPLLRALQFSALSFTGNTPTTIPSALVAHVSLAVTTQSTLGIVFAGVLAASVYRWISLRQGR